VTLHRRIALKLLPSHRAADSEAVARLLQEARAAATLDHPNICAIHEIAEEDGRRFIVMQYVEGETLAKTLTCERLSTGRAIAVAAQVADALADAHAHGFIHRDVKPANIILTPRGQAKVLDFGLAKSLAETPDSRHEGETTRYLSTPGTLMGTLPYMSPEQMRGETLDGRADIFSLGVTLYEMLSGRQPFARASNADTVSPKA
jgi:eukaryotic-like serine/threonine-protein kinase